MTRLLLLFALTSFSYAPLWAQKANLFNIRAGYLQSNTIVDITNTIKVGIVPLEEKPGFYAGLAYEHLLSALLTSQIEINFQQKGYRSQDILWGYDTRNNYNYIGITPTVGIRLIKNLSFSVGPEVNLLVSKSTTSLNSKLVELGLVGRGRYQIDRIGITGGYFRGLTFYDRSYTKTYSFRNQNWQLGLFYQLSKR